jgi:hypothetical protein
MSLGRIRARPTAWPSLAFAYPALWPSRARRGEQLLRTHMTVPLRRQLDGAVNGARKGDTQRPHRRGKG